MQKFNWSIVVGSLTVAIGIIMGCQGIVTAINDRPFVSVPGSFEVYNRGQAEYGDFLTEQEAAEYLKVQWETMEQWIEVGKLEGAYTVVEMTGNDENGQVVKAGKQHIFSKAKLIEFMNDLMENR